jgi:hypothetical protein
MVEKGTGQPDASWSEYEIHNRLGQLQRRDTSTTNLSTALGWLFWLLPGIGIAALVVYLVMSLLGLDVARVIVVMTSGQGGDLFGFLAGSSFWGLGQAGHAALDNWPLVMMAGALFLLMWLIKNL